MKQQELQPDGVGYQVVPNSPRENPDPLLTPAEAAAWIGCSPQTLASARCTRTGVFASIPWVKLGKRVAYRRSDLQRWVEQQVRGAAVEA